MALTVHLLLVYVGADVYYHICLVDILNVFYFILLLNSND